MAHELTFSDVARLTDKLHYCGTALRTFKVLKIEDLYSLCLIKFPSLDLDQFQAMVRLMYLTGLVVTDRPGTAHRSIRWIGEAIDPRVTIHLYVADTSVKHATVRNGALHPVCIHCGRMESDPIHLK